MLNRDGETWEGKQWWRRRRGAAARKRRSLCRLATKRAYASPSPSEPFRHIYFFHQFHAPFEAMTFPGAIVAL